jgi:oligopeptide/dipeptide ABC transporter ATP-binding protein
MLASSLLDAVPPPGMTAGSITYHPRDGGKPIDVLNLAPDDLKMFRWEEVAMVFQGAMSSFNPTMKIREHFRETIEAHEMDIVERMGFAGELLRDLYLDPDRVFASYPHELSGGMKQRALVALSLVLDPEVLVMDEPTASLDLLMQRSITNMLTTLRDEYDLTILFITHDLPLVAHLVDRLAVMYAFDLVELGDRNDILLNGRHPYTRALLRSVPTIDTPVNDMETIEGESPDPLSVPTGCSYHPEYHPITEGHAAKCFFWEDSEEAVPYTLGETGDRQ